MVRESNTRSVDLAATEDRLARRAEARRLEILQAAARVFRRSGFAETGMREIAVEADLSPGNLYHYFRGKHELLYFCQDRALDRLLANLDREQQPDRRPLERIRAVIRAHICCLLDEFEGSVAHLEVEALPDELRTAIVDKRDRYEQGLRELIDLGIRDGELAPCDAGLVTRAILGAANWTARWYRPDGPRSADAVADSVTTYLIRGLEPRGATP